MQFKGCVLVMALFLVGCHAPESTPRANDTFEDPGSRSYYVSPDGNDMGAGTLNDPWETLGRACAIARPGDRIYLREGIYPETLRPACSGEPDRLIQFGCYENEEVVLVSGRPVTGWQHIEDGVYVADCPVDLGAGLNQLVCDGRLMVEARTPNVPGYQELIHTFGMHRACATISGDDSLQLCDVSAVPVTSEDVLYIGRHGGAWGTQTAMGTIDATGQMTFRKRTAKGYLSWWQGKGEGYWVGARAYLDTEQEWVLDRQNAKLYFRPPGGADPNTMKVYVKDRAFAIDLKERKHIAVDGVTTLMGSVLMDGSEQCTIRNSTLLYGGHHSYFDNPYAYETTPAERSGVLMSGRSNTLEHCRIAWNAGASVLMGGLDNRVLNCRLHDSGLLGSYYSGIYIFQQEKLTGGGHEIGHNTLYNFGRGAIHVSSIGKWGAPGKYARPMDIHHNEIRNAMLICDDGGAFYQFCTDGVGGEIRNNWIFSSRGENIYFDNHSRGWFVHHNVVGGKVNVNFPNDTLHIYNNTLLTTRYGIPKYFWSKENFVSRNVDTFYQGGESWDGATCNGVRPTYVNFVAEGRGGLKYRVKSISQGGFPAVKPRVATVDGSEIPSFNKDYYGAYADGTSPPGAPQPWEPGCGWGGDIPEVPSGPNAPLALDASAYAEGRGVCNNALYITTTQSVAWACFKDINFANGYSHVAFEVMLEDEMDDAVIELRLDRVDGARIAGRNVGFRAEERHQFFPQVARLAHVTGCHDVYLHVRATRKMNISQLTLFGGSPTPLYAYNPRRLVHAGETKVETTAYGSGSKAWLMVDYDFKHPDIYLSGEFELKGCTPRSWIFFSGVDFGSGRDHLMVNLGASKYSDAAPRVELRSGLPDGALLGALDISKREEGKWNEQRMDLSSASGVHDVFLVFPRSFEGGLNYILLQHPEQDRKTVEQDDVERELGSDKTAL